MELKRKRAFATIVSGDISGDEEEDTGGLGQSADRGQGRVRIWPFILTATFSLFFFPPLIRRIIVLTLNCRLLVLRERESLLPRYLKTSLVMRRRTPEAWVRVLVAVKVE